MKYIILSFFLMFHTMNYLPAQTQIIAHRGYWDYEGSAQNSVAALKSAQQERLYGSEFDVLVTSDGIAVVHHDDNIGSHLIEDTPYHKIQNHKLENGETLPTLEEYLIQGKNDSTVKLILEIKPHGTTNKEDCAALIVTRLVEEYQLENQVEYISFSLNICKKIKELCPDTKVSYLEGNLSPKDIKRAGLTGIDYHYSIFKQYPEWIEQAHELGLTVNAWTVNNAEDMKYLIENKIDYITTDKPVLLKEILNNNS